MANTQAQSLATRLQLCLGRRKVPTSAVLDTTLRTPPPISILALALYPTTIQATVRSFLSPYHTTFLLSRAHLLPLQAFPTTALSRPPTHSWPTIQFVQPSAPFTQGTSQTQNLLPSARPPSSSQSPFDANLNAICIPSTWCAWPQRSERAAPCPLKHSASTFLLLLWPSQRQCSILSSYQISIASQTPTIVPAVYRIASCCQRHSAITSFLASTSTEAL